MLRFHCTVQVLLVTGVENSTSSSQEPRIMEVVTSSTNVFWDHLGLIFIWPRGKENIQKHFHFKNTLTQKCHVLLLLTFHWQELITRPYWNTRVTGKCNLWLSGHFLKITSYYWSGSWTFGGIAVPASFPTLRDCPPSHL